MLAARGILTARGGMTSHAAVVARGWGQVLRGRLRRSRQIDYAAGSFRVDAGGRNVTVRRGDRHFP